MVFEPDPTWSQSERYLPLAVDNYVQVFDIYSFEHGWNGWARGVLWGSRIEQDGIFPLSIVVPELLVIDGGLPRLGSGDGVLTADPLPPRPLQISSVIPPPPPLPVAVGGSGISVDRIWRCDATGALLFVGDARCASDLSWLRGAQIGCIVNCTGNLELYHDGETDLQYYRFDVARFSIRRHSGMYTESDVVDEIGPMLYFVRRALFGEDCMPTNVLLHCKEGRHRAGAVAIMCILYFTECNLSESVAYLRSCRPRLEMTHDFKPLLLYLETLPLRSSI